MAAELELAAWTSSGEKLWTTVVEPPWSYQVFDDLVQLDVMGKNTESRPTPDHRYCRDPS